MVVAGGCGRYGRLPTVTPQYGGGVRTPDAVLLDVEASTTEPWSRHVRGPIQKRDGEVDEATLNGWFQPFRLFDEAVEQPGSPPTAWRWGPSSAGKQPSG
jgi:hypothetical protein